MISKTSKQHLANLFVPQEKKIPEKNKKKI